MVALFVLSIGVVAYAYAVYPLVLAVWAALAPKPVRKDRAPVPVSIVLAVRDEEKHIEARLANFFEQDYPQELVEVIVVSDGSTDRTAELARAAGKGRAHVVELAEGGGKAQAVNAGVAHAANEIVVFADARQLFSRTALLELAAPFSDPSVGAVSGELVIASSEGSEVGEGVGLYWSYEKFVRRKESEIDSVVGASGSIYAVRKSLFSPLPAGALLDDFLVPMRIVLEGYRVVFERAARAYDRAAERASQEFSRKVRTLAGNFQALSIEKSLMDPRRNRLFFQMVSHKLARLAVPYFLAAAFVSNLFLDAPVFRAILAAQVLFYISPLITVTPLAGTRAGALGRVAWTFIVLNAAAVAGLWVYASGGEKEVWRSSRP